jgi:enoyl-CoA hydratase/carnithine racemase
MDASSEQSTHIAVTVDGDRATVSLTRPEVRNAQTPEMWKQLADIGRSMSDDVRFVILRGEGDDFSSGLDRNALAGPMIEQLRDDPNPFIDAAQAGFAVWNNIPQVVIAQVQGNAIGAGFQLALASDVIVAAPNSRFAMRETSLGLIPDLGGTGALVDALGYRRTFALCATGDFLSAHEAQRWGVVHRVADDASAAVAVLIEQLRGLDIGALRDLKAVLRTVARDQQSWEAERDVQLRRLAALFGPSST